MENNSFTKIIFTNTLDIPEDYKPAPASHEIPEWYKKMDSYIGENSKKPSGKGTTTATIKRCMPVFDAISGGYILYTPTDVYVSQKPVEYADGKHFEKTGETRLLTASQIKKKKLIPTQPWFEWPSLNPIQFHPIEQAPEHPNRNGHQSGYPKWINYWSIKTPPGYSTLFVQPFHRESVFTILPGIVDTDTYTAPVNFPFVLNDVLFEGMIPAGTPMAQVLPFKRDAWEMSIGQRVELEEQDRVTRKLRTKLFDSYKNSIGR